MQTEWIVDCVPLLPCQIHPSPDPIHKWDADKVDSDSDPFSTDYFQPLPDPLVLLILNLIEDVKTLGRCSVVCKRFNSLVPQVDNVLVKIDCIVSGSSDVGGLDPSPVSKTGSFFSSLLKKFLFLSFLKHLCSNSTSCSSNPQLSHRSPAEVLKNFTNIQKLRIVLPSGDCNPDEGVLVKWKAEFGSTLQRCVILGGTKIDRRQMTEVEAAAEDNGSIPESFYTNGGLKLRVVWTITSLIAATSRHYLLQQIIRDHPTLRSLVLTDVDGHGTLTMGESQLKEFREKPLAAAAAANRTQVPALNMKLRYAPYLELPGGIGMQGATLVAIRPSGGNSSTSGDSGFTRKDAENFICTAFDGPFDAAVKALVKRRTYLLEMNSF